VSNKGLQQIVAALRLLSPGVSGKLHGRNNTKRNEV
jgi:hypothetical protein